MTAETVFVCHKGAVAAMEFVLSVAVKASIDNFMLVGMAKRAVLFGMFTRNALNSSFLSPWQVKHTWDVSGTSETVIISGV